MLKLQRTSRVWNGSSRAGLSRGKGHSKAGGTEGLLHPGTRRPAQGTGAQPGSEPPGSLPPAGLARRVTELSEVTSRCVCKRQSRGVGRGRMWKAEAVCHETGSAISRTRRSVSAEGSVSSATPGTPPQAGAAQRQQRPLCAPCLRELSGRRRSRRGQQPHHPGRLRLPGWCRSPAPCGAPAGHEVVCFRRQVPSPRTAAGHCHADHRHRHVVSSGGRGQASGRSGQGRSGGSR